MSPDSIHPYLRFLTDHRYGFVFVVTLIDSTGLPFPGRLLLIGAGALATSWPDAAILVGIAALGAVAGDHVLYLLGSAWGDRLLALYCRVTIGGRRCIEKAHARFRRYGAPAIIIGRFVAGVRIVATALAGSGAISYPRFFLYDAAGAVLWSAAFVLLGYILGDQWSRMVERLGGIQVVALLALVAIAAVVGFRVWWRYRAAKPARARA